VQTVAVEDTRRSRILLERIDAHPARIVSLHDFNESSRLSALLDELQRGHDVALVSDAGTPLISDPGFLLVRECWRRGVKVSPVPGPSALTAALSASPLPVDRFQFLGFLPQKQRARTTVLKEALASPHAVVFFEAPHRMSETLRTIAGIVGGERRVLVAKELTKVHERIELGSALELLERLSVDTALDRGEFVCMVEGGDGPSLRIDGREAMDVLLGELKPAQAARLAAKLTGVPRAQLYAYALTQTREGD
jgi:16S rRNA (cytidine1402-2'-O)-methyltransferase